MLVKGCVSRSSTPRPSIEESSDPLLTAASLRFLSLTTLVVVVVVVESGSETCLSEGVNVDGCVANEVAVDAVEVAGLPGIGWMAVRGIKGSWMAVWGPDG